MPLFSPRCSSCDCGGQTRTVQRAGQAADHQGPAAAASGSATAAAPARTVAERRGARTSAPLELHHGGERPALRARPMAAPSQHPQLPIFLRASVARVQEAEVEALKKQIEELQMQLKVAKKSRRLEPRGRSFAPLILPFAFAAGRTQTNLPATRRETSPHPPFVATSECWCGSQPGLKVFTLYTCPGSIATRFRSNAGVSDG